MKNKLLKEWSLALVIGATFFLIAALASSPALAGVTELKMASFCPPSSQIYQALVVYAKDVKEKTNGEIDIKIHPPGGLCKPFEQFDLLKRGAIALSSSAGPYHASKIPEAVIEFSLPCSFIGKAGTTEAADQMYEFFYEWRDGAIKKIFDGLYARHGITLVGGGSGGGYGILTNFPVKTLDDFKGKKMRTMGLNSYVAQKLGSSPVTVSNAEQYLALQRGTVDGTIFTYYSLEAYKLNEVIKYIVYPAMIATPYVGLYANTKMFTSLPEKHQKTITDLYMQHMKAYTKEAAQLEREYIDLSLKKGLKEAELSPEDTKKLISIARSTWEIPAKKSETSKKLIELLHEYLKEKGL